MVSAEENVWKQQSWNDSLPKHSHLFVIVYSPGVHIETTYVGYGSKILYVPVCYKDHASLRTAFSSICTYPELAQLRLMNQ